ncbi:hypothetical protein JAAARDRAFT_129317 [Jaapia argillacea MUCL 33604]|uniref:Alanine dehydrogenase/pyridine nucleotide transhydrogenase N-terminal domain-containing protein n=1 Tax=Jaapia argillacea MUCL 33604 TaxID=933084 RepID=A0A067PT53_9AGAM|nr:hypothetical protein JAAARDRAFT_129317 [Jaapia argillacea MUCL 33604]
MTIPLLRRSPFSFLPHRSLSTAAPHRVTVGIRREDPARIWERRCPLTPDDVHDLVSKEGVRVLVQECARRVFKVDEFVKAGAEVHPTLEPAHIIIGIKETPLDELLTSPVPSPSSSSSTKVPRTHLMFSHTIKGQPYNMPLLSRFVSGHPTPDPLSYDSDSLPRLIDYELLTGEDGKRTVGFGWFAGVAGALESLSTLAHLHLEAGISSPFLYTPRPHTHPSIPSLRSSLRSIGNLIVENGTPRELGPVVIGVTGTGKVAQGMLSILDELPIVRVEVKDLPGLVSNPDTDLRKIYLVHALPKDYFSRMDGGKYERSDYYTNPGLYKSDFGDKVYPYLTLLLNGTGWSEGFPRLMTNEQLGLALRKADGLGGMRGRCVGDVSCDVHGGLQFLPHPSTLSQPSFTTLPSCLPKELGGVRVMAVDILPASLPLDASVHFSKGLGRYVGGVVRGYRGEEVEGEVGRALERATVVRGGKLSGGFGWLTGPLGKWREGVIGEGDKSGREVGDRSVMGTVREEVGKKRVLMLGSGMVAGPAIEEIAKRGDVELIVGSNSLDEAERLVKGLENVKAVLIDVEDKERIGGLVDEADVVVSLLPVPFHPSIAEICIERRKHMITASYISPPMKDLHARALGADTLILNEIGLDPGVDHCSALSLLNDIRSAGREVESFVSFCGGLPAPEFVEGGHGPLGYKFSWSVLGVLRAALQGAQFKLAGKEYEIPGEKILKQYFPEVPISDEFRLEGLANRNSLPYAGVYRMGDVSALRSVLRGTLRYPGFCELMHSFKQIGLLSFEPLIQPLDSWSSLTRRAIEGVLGHTVPEGGPTLRELKSIVGREAAPKVIEALTWLGMLPSSLGGRTGMALPRRPVAPIELFALVLGEKLKYREGERDMVILHHEIVARPSSPPSQPSSPTSQPSPPAEQHIYTSTLTTYGTPRHSAMALCVGLPVAFAALRVLDGGVGMRGVRGPEEESVWRGVLGGMERVGLGMKEGMRVGAGMEGVLVDGLGRSLGRR